ncbi:hypothetical protein GQ43DRAFT_494122 [Delitschia confertaspora ATCC 74209]|uniref:Rhodopsin domain-containing protein n=1 Tax=Delitschia confertaspora ATCC 74209 TaxID=1513339 RepID=A0A9P4MME6_9PLEO|nr:hypothetical protein GQ43DRAFT_494122 [Delitschia confertaspora ATCC 74209]
MAMEMPVLPSLFSTELVVLNTVFPVLATIAVAVRLYARSNRTGRGYVMLADDWLTIAALFFCWAITANTFVGAAQAGIDTQKGKNPLNATIATVRTLWIEGFLLATTLALVKISIMQFYYRIFATKASNIFRYSAQVMYGILILWWISSIICQFLVTDPVNASWNPLIKFKYRYNYNDWTLAFASLSLVFDVVILFFPLPMIKKLHIDFKRKMSVMGIFWLGAFCCVSAAVRLYYLHKEITKVTSGTADGTTDPTANPYANISRGFIWAHIEPNCSIIAACLPTYGPLFHNGRSAHSLIRSLRSALFSGSTKNGSSAGASKGFSSGSTQQLTIGSTQGAGYYELKEGSTHTGKTGPTVRVTSTTDVEAQKAWEGDSKRIAVTTELRHESL